jgi:hypothetical protein
VRYARWVAWSLSIRIRGRAKGGAKGARWHAWCSDRGATPEFRRKEADMRSVTDTEARSRAVKALGCQREALHELDYEDVALSRAALALIRRAARGMLRRLGAEDAGPLPMGRALALFLDHVFWDERSGGLILCAEFPERSVCLPIPRDFWGLKPRLSPVQ